MALPTIPSTDLVSGEEDYCGPPIPRMFAFDVTNDETTDSTSHDQSEEDEEYLDEVFDEEAFSRGRSRSHSMHANDNGPPESIQPILVPFDPTPFSVDVMENRSGPLQEREVIALQKGLEEATSPIDEKQKLEEEEEKEEIKKTSTFRPEVDPRLRKIKILMLGDSGVGKTSLVNRYTKDQFNHTLVGTVGVDFKCKKVEVDGEGVNLQIWDTAGQEHFHRITQAYYGGSHAIMVVFDISESKTLDSVSYWMQCIVTHASDSVPIILIGNKKDLRDDPNHSFKCTPPGAGAKAAALATEIARKRNRNSDVTNDNGSGGFNDILYYETSAKTAENVDEAYMALLRNILARTHSVPSPKVVGANTSRLVGQNSKPTGTSGTIFTFARNNPSDNSNQEQSKGKSWLSTWFK